MIELEPIPVMYRFALAALGAGLLCGQSRQSPQELLKEAVTFHQQGKLDEAIRDYDQFLDIYPDAVEVRSNLGAALVAQGKYARAIDEYKLALLKKPEPKLELNLALAYYKTDNFRDAVVELEKVHQAEPANRQATILLADCYVRQGQNKKTIDLLSPLYDAGPEDQAVEYVLGTALARDGQADRAQQVINPLLSGPDSAEKHMLMGTTKFGARDYTSAIAELRQAMDMNPNLPEVQSYYAQALFSSGETEASRKVFDEELARNPNDFQSNVHLGLMARQEEKYDAAMKYLNRALAARPGDVAVRYQIALVKMSTGKEDAAREEIERIVAEAPTFTEAHVSLSILYFREKRKEDGNRERAIVQKLNAERQAQQPGAKMTDQAEKPKGSQ
jgi:tetratricopeptide (TPR) repeat protein